MAKISRLLLNEAKSKMTDEEFFSSSYIKNHFNTIIEGICKKYDRKLEVILKNSGDYIAFTNGNKIVVNTGCSWVKDQATRQEKYYIVIGIILHECGHILYTDFLLAQRSMKQLQANSLYPVISYSDELENIFDEKLAYKLMDIYAALDNCIEDGNIEKRIVRYVPGYGECLMKMRKLQLMESNVSSYDKLKDQMDKNDRVDILLDLVLIYAKYSFDNTGGIKDDLTYTFSQMQPEIDQAVNALDPLQRKKLINKVFDKLVAFICDEIIDKDDEESEERESEDTGSDSDDMESGEVSTDPDIDTSEDSDASDYESKTSGSEKKLDDLLSKIATKLKDMIDKTERVNELSDAPVTEKGVLSDESDEEDSSIGSDSDLTYLEDKAAEEKIAKEYHNKIEKEMGRISECMLKDRSDKFPSIEQYLEPDSHAIEEYDIHHAELDRIARRIKKNLDKIIQQRKRGDVKKGLYIGKQFDAPHAYRKDKRIFAQKILPENIPDMEVCVLVDCSGSMRGSRMNRARDCAYITWQFCKQMEIPCSVYGHTTDTCPERHVMMKCVAHPMNIDADDGKRIFVLRADNDNRDGWAVNFCGEALMKSRAANKLLLIISDGVPAAVGYDRNTGKKDCQAVVKKYKQKGIKIVTAGIDSCAEQIRSVYLDGVPAKYAAKFLDYTDMSKLPQAFATLIKKELLL